MTKTQLEWISWKAGQSMVQDGNLDTNLAASGLRQAAEKYLALLEMPSHRPIQQQYEYLMATKGG